MTYSSVAPHIRYVATCYKRWAAAHTYVHRCRTLRGFRHALNNGKRCVCAVFCLVASPATPGRRCRGGVADPSRPQVRTAPGHYTTGLLACGPRDSFFVPHYKGARCAAGPQHEKRHVRGELCGQKRRHQGGTCTKTKPRLSVSLGYTV